MTLGIAPRTPFAGYADRPTTTPMATPADVDLYTMRLLRSEALLRRLAPPDRPWGAFGNRPA